MTIPRYGVGERPQEGPHSPKGNRDRGSADPERMTKKVDLTVDQFSIYRLVYDLYPTLRQAQYKLFGSGQALRPFDDALNKRHCDSGRNKPKHHNNGYPQSNRLAALPCKDLHTTLKSLGDMSLWDFSTKSDE